MAVNQKILFSISSSSNQLATQYHTIIAFIIALSKWVYSLVFILKKFKDMYYIHT